MIVVVPRLEWLCPPRLASITQGGTISHPCAWVMQCVFIPSESVISDVRTWSGAKKMSMLACLRKPLPCCLSTPVTREVST